MYNQNCFDEVMDSLPFVYLRNLFSLRLKLGRELVDDKLDHGLELGEAGTARAVKIEQRALGVKVVRRVDRLHLKRGPGVALIEALLERVVFVVFEIGINVFVGAALLRRWATLIAALLYRPLLALLQSPHRSLGAHHCLRIVRFQSSGEGHPSISKNRTKMAGQKQNFV